MPGFVSRHISVIETHTHAWIYRRTTSRPEQPLGDPASRSRAVLAHRWASWWVCAWAALHTASRTRANISCPAALVYTANIIPSCIPVRRLPHVLTASCSNDSQALQKAVLSALLNCSADCTFGTTRVLTSTCCMQYVI